jgi:hypothetical protein
MLIAIWLLHAVRLAAALETALLAMQAPAVTQEYQAALLQLVRSSDQEIAQRMTSAQRYYGISPAADESHVLAQLRTLEPSNAETLATCLSAGAAFIARMRASSRLPNWCARLQPPRTSPVTRKALASR